MFKIADKNTYRWPVTVHIPQDGGKFTKATFDAEFQALPQNELDQIVRDAVAGDPDASVAARCLCGWKGVQDADDTELPYSDGAKDRLLNITYVRAAVVQAYFESIGGARRKN